MGPVQSVANVKSIARDGTETTLSSSLYYLKANQDYVAFDAPPIAHRVEINYVAGYGDADTDIPAPIKQAILFHLAEIYDGRAGASAIPTHSLTMYRAFRNIML